MIQYEHERTIFSALIFHLVFYGREFLLFLQIAATQRARSFVSVRFYVFALINILLIKF